MNAIKTSGCMVVIRSLNSRRPMPGITTSLKTRSIQPPARASSSSASYAVLAWKGPDTPITEVMSRNPKTCRLDDDIAVVEQIMADAQVRRVPVLDQRGRCLGIVAQADLALNHQAVSEREVPHLVERISTPTHAAGAST